MSATDDYGAGAGNPGFDTDMGGDNPDIETVQESSGHATQIAAGYDSDSDSGTFGQDPSEGDAGLGVEATTSAIRPTSMGRVGIEPGGVGDGVDARDLADVSDLADTNLGNLGEDRQTIWTRAASSDNE